MKSNLKQVIGVSLVSLQILACIGNLMGGFENSVFHITAPVDLLNLLAFFIVGLVGLVLYLLGSRDANQTRGPRR